MLQCAYCNRLITGQYTEYNQKNYHTDCYNLRIAVTCSMCKLPISGAYIQDEWGNAACAYHKAECCASCRRITDANNPQVNGRRYCSECTQNRAEQRHIAPIYQKILRVYATYGFGDVLPNVPVVLTDSDTLNRKTGGPALPTQSAALGLTETTTTGPYHRYTIYMLYGLPLLEFEAVLAHELLHTWLHEHDVEMSQPEVEGFCNIGAYMLLTNARNKHGEILKQDMVANPDPVYGEGFMKMLRMVQREGWLPFIAYIKARKRKHGWGWFS